MRFFKVNNKDFSPVLKYSENTPDIVVNETYDKTSWKNENGGMIQDANIIARQEYGNSKKYSNNLPLKEVEIYETTKSCSFWIYQNIHS